MTKDHNSFINKWVLTACDVHHTPIHIQNIDEFISKAESLYYEAMNEYHVLYEQLKRQRSVKKVMDNG